MRPHQVGNPEPSNPNNTSWLNRAAFQVPAQYTFGTTLGRNTLRGESYSNLDVSVFRNFRFKERLNIQFRGKAFNALNQTIFANPVSNLSDINFGRIFSTRSTERQPQFGLKLLF